MCMLFARKMPHSIFSEENTMADTPYTLHPKNPPFPTQPTCTSTPTGGPMFYNEWPPRPCMHEEGLHTRWNKAMIHRQSSSQYIYTCQHTIIVLNKWQIIALATPNAWANTCMSLLCVVSMACTCECHMSCGKHKQNLLSDSNVKLVFVIGIHGSM